MTDLDDVLLSEEEFNDEVSKAADFVRSYLGETKTDSFMPMLHVVFMTPKETRNHGIYALAMDFNDHDMKRKILGILGSKMHEGKQIPLMAILISEAWTVTNPPKGVQPRDCPDRKEVIIVQAATIDKKHQGMVMLHCTRDEKNHIVLTREEEARTEGVENRLLWAFFGGFANAASKMGSLN